MSDPRNGFIIAGCAQMATIIIVGFILPFQPDVPGCVLCLALVVIFTVIQSLFRNRKEYLRLKNGDPDGLWANPMMVKRFLMLAGAFTVMGCIPIVPIIIGPIELRNVFMELALALYVWTYAATTFYMVYLHKKNFTKERTNHHDKQDSDVQ